MTRLLTYSALVASALVLQLTVLDTLPFPGGIAPDLVLLVVVAIALTSGPLPGLVSGFGGGLALDLAPPAVHAIGAYALVFCLIGYICGRAAGEIDRSAFLPLAAMALGALGGSLLYTLAGTTFGEPDVTWAAARHVLPLSITYDVLLSPFVLYAVLRLLRWAGQTVQDPAAAAGRARAAQVAPPYGRAGAPRQPKIRSHTGGPAGWIGAGAASRIMAASGRSSSEFGITMTTSSERSAPHAPPPRLRFGQPKPSGPRPAQRGVFAGGSVVGGSSVRLRLRVGRGSRLASRTGQPPWSRPRGYRSAQPRFGRAQSAMALTAPARPGRSPRFGRRRFATARSVLALLGRGGGWLAAAWRPRRWWATGRPGDRRTGGL